MKKVLTFILTIILSLGMIFSGVMVLKKYSPTNYDKLKNIFLDTKDYIEEEFFETEDNSNTDNEDTSNKFTIFVGGELSSDKSSNTAIIIISSQDKVLEEGMTFLFDNTEYTIGRYSPVEEGFEVVVPMDLGIYLYQGEFIIVYY